MDIFELIEAVKSKGASDLHIAVGSPPLMRVKGNLARMEDYAPLTSEDVKSMFMQIATVDGLEKFDTNHELDFKYILPDGSRLRCNAAQERGQISLSIRMLTLGVPSIDELQLPDICKKLARLERGLVVISGPTGSGKTTTQAAMIEYINTNQTRHVLSFEDPIEYSHPNIKSKITQRELGGDTNSFAEALKHALRHDPDVIVVGEMRDSETAAAVIPWPRPGIWSSQPAMPLMPLRPWKELLISFRVMNGCWYKPAWLLYLMRYSAKPWYRGQMDRVESRR